MLKNRFIFGFLFIVISLLTIMTIKPAFSGGETAKDYHPLEGTTKVVKSSEGETIYTYGAKTQFQGKQAMPRFAIFGKGPVDKKTIERIIPSLTDFYEITPDAIKILGSKNVTETITTTIIYEPPKTFLKFPLKKGLSWEEKNIRKIIKKEGESVKDKVKSTITKYEVLGEETITVPAGRFDCWKIERISIDEKEDGTRTSLSNTTVWYTKKLGAIKSILVYRDGKSKESLLKSYEFK